MCIRDSICFSPFVPDLDVKHKLGYLCMAIVSMHLVVNLVAIGWTTYHDLRRKFFFKIRKNEYSK